jgi:hypothetical protein
VKRNRIDLPGWHFVARALVRSPTHLASLGKISHDLNLEAHRNRSVGALT